MKRAIKQFGILLWLSVVVLACNLSNSDLPPTLVPNPPGLTPQATLGYATPDPLLAPAATIPPASQTEAQIYAILNQVDSDRMMLHISTLQNFYTRHINSTQTDPNQGIGAAFNYIYSQFMEIQAQAPNFAVFSQEFEGFYNSITSIQRNLIGYLQGTEAGAGTIVVGAHYDSRTDDLTDAVGFAPAADDNGSGTAAVIEMARILSRYPQRSSIMFVLFSGEEEGRQGSKAFVRDYIAGNNIDVLAMINIDTIGSVNDRFGTVNDTDIHLYSDNDTTNLSVSRHLARTIELICAYHGLALQVRVMNSADRDGRYGDHFSFTELGYPAIRFIEALEDTPNREGRDTINFVEPYYLVRTTQTILQTLLGLAGGLRPPRQLVLRDAGTIDQDGLHQYTLVWDAVPGATGYVVALRRAGSAIYDQRFPVTTNETAPWGGFAGYEAVAVAAIDQNGLLGPVSVEYVINRNP